MPRSAPYFRGLRYALATLAGLLMGAAFTLGNVVDYGMGSCDCQDGYFSCFTFGCPFTIYARDEHHPGPSHQPAGIRITHEAYYPVRAALNLLIAVGASVASGRAVLWATLRQYSLQALLGFVSVVGATLVAVPVILNEPIFWRFSFRFLPPWLSVPLFVGLLGEIFMLGNLVVRFIRRFASIKRSQSVAHG